MKVIEIKKYLYKGKEYKSLESVKDEVHNTIGIEIIDKINRVCPPQKHKDLLNMLEVLCSPEVRKVLMECYNVNFEKEEYTENGWEETNINILDI